MMNRHWIKKLHFTQWKGWIHLICPLSLRPNPTTMSETIISTDFTSDLLIPHIDLIHVSVFCCCFADQLHWLRYQPCPILWTCFDHEWLHKPLGKLEWSSVFSVTSMSWPVNSINLENDCQSWGTFNKVVTEWQHRYCFIVRSKLR
jgi:hypothetical protein